MKKPDPSEVMREVFGKYVNREHPEEPELTGRVVSEYDPYEALRRRPWAKRPEIQ